MTGRASPPGDNANFLRCIGFWKNASVPPQSTAGDIMKLTGYFQVAALCVLAASCQTAETGNAGAAPTGKVDIQEEIIGHSFRYTLSGNTGTVSYRQTSLTAHTHAGTVRGRLRISGDRICTRFQRIQSDRETCFTVTRTDYGFKTSHGGTLRPL